MNILLTYKNNSMFARESIEDVVNKYNKDYNLIELVVKDLENYRNSALFKNVWAKTKVLFNDKPQAWSVNKNVSLS